MKDTEIIEIIRDFYKEFAYEDKMSGTSKYIFLSLYIKRQEVAFQQAFIDFFIREIKDDRYGLLHDALAILGRLNNKQVIPQLFEIFVECYRNDKDCKNIFLLLMKLGDTKPEHIAVYTDYVHQKLAQNAAFNYSYIIDYIAINTNDALSILSDFYIDILTKEQELSWNNMYIFYLAYFFMKNELMPLFQLIDMVYNKNHDIGVLLRKLLLQYAIHSPCKNKEEWLQKKKLEEKLCLTCCE
jgi:hypothetical protein